MFKLWILFTASCIFPVITSSNTANRYMVHYDLTKDSKVDGRELRTVAYMDYKLPPTITDEILRETDRNDDKLIDRNEIVAAVMLIKKHVARATLRWLQDHDTNGDGLLNELELFESIYMEHGLSSKNVTSCFRENDVNNDGQLTPSELVETLHCIRLLALKEGRQLMKIYDTDGDHRLNIREAQMLADLRYDIGPEYAAIVFESVSHRNDQTINELELIDFLAELRQEAAIVALDKLSGLDQNGDEAVSFSELLQGYDRQLKKLVLKKIFSKVDVNKNAYIDPIEFVSLQNLVADEIRLQSIQAELEQRKPIIGTTTATSPPSLIIFTRRKGPRSLRSPRRRIRRSDPETEKKLVVKDESLPSVKEVMSSNANSVHFSAATVTTVPKFMVPNEEDRKFLSDGARLIAEKFASSKKPEQTEAELSGPKKIDYNLVADDKTAPEAHPLNSEDFVYTPATDDGELMAGTTIDDSGFVRDQNGAIINDPRSAYIKKFEKFIDFLQNTIRKVAKIVKESRENDAARLQSLVRDINIRRSNETADNMTNVETNVSGIQIPTTTENVKIKTDPIEIYERIRDDRNLIVHTVVDSSEYETAEAKEFKGRLGDPFLQLDRKPEEQTQKNLKSKNRRRTGRKELKYAPEERSFRDAVEEGDEEEEDSGSLEEDDQDPKNVHTQIDSSEYQTALLKKYKSDIVAPASSREAIVEPPRKSRKKSGKNKLDPESDDNSKNREEQRRRKIRRRYPDEKNHIPMDSSEHKTMYSKRYKNDIRVPTSSQELGRKHKSRFLKTDADKAAPELEDNEEPAEPSKQELERGASNKELSTNKQADSNEEAFGGTSAKMIKQTKIKDSLTNEHGVQVHSDTDSSEFEEVEVVGPNRTMHLEEGKLVNEFGLPVHTQIGGEVKEYKILKSKPMFSVDERITNEHGWEVHSRVHTDNYQILESQDKPPEETQLHVMHTPTSSEEDESFDEALGDILNATLYKTNESYVGFETKKSGEKGKANSVTVLRKEPVSASTTGRTLLQTSETRATTFSKISTISASETSSKPAPETSTALAPETSTTPAPGTSVIERHISSSNNTVTSKPTTSTAELTTTGTEVAESRKAAEIMSRKISEAFEIPSAKFPELKPESATEHENETDVSVEDPRNRNDSEVLENLVFEGMNDRNEEVVIEVVNSTEIELGQKKRKKCIRRRHPSQRRKCLVRRKKPEQNILVEITIPGTNTTAVIHEEETLWYECRLRKKSTLCRKSRKRIDFETSTETSRKSASREEINSKEAETIRFQYNSNSNSTETEISEVNKRRPAKNEDLLVQALREYQKYLEKRESKERRQKSK